MTSTTLNTLSALQTAILGAQKSKIDFSGKTDNSKMNALIQQITAYTSDATNHTSEGLADLKKFEAYVAELRRDFTKSVAARAKVDAERTREEARQQKKVLAAEEKERKAAERKRATAAKQSQKKALLGLQKILKPVSPMAHKKDPQLLKWAMVGARQNWTPIRKAQIKLANAGKSKNGEFARFCKWLEKPDEDTLIAAGCEHKRDYNKYVWENGTNDFDASDQELSWDEYKKSSAAPWNTTQ